MMTYKNNSKKFKTTSKKKNNGLIFNFKSTKNLSNKRNRKLPIKPTEKSGNSFLNQVILNRSLKSKRQNRSTLSNHWSNSNQTLKLKKKSLKNFKRLRSLTKWQVQYSFEKENVNWRRFEFSQNKSFLTLKNGFWFKKATRRLNKETKNVILKSSWLNKEIIRKENRLTEWKNTEDLKKIGWCWKVALIIEKPINTEGPIN